MYEDYFYYDESSPSCLRWKVDRFGGKDYKVKSVSKGDIAGSVSNGNEYYRVTFNGIQLKVHQVIAYLHGIMEEGFSIDHIDGNVLNNKITNLRAVPHKINSRNQKKRATNISGITGVYPKRKDGVIIGWVADICTDFGRTSKSFSVYKYSNAFELACEYRNRLLKENHEYSERHGT